MTHPTMPVSMPRYVGVGSPGDARLNKEETWLLVLFLLQYNLNSYNFWGPVMGLYVAPNLFM